MLGGYSSPSVVTPFICIGDREEAANKTKLISLGVTHVLNAAAQLPNYHEEHFLYHHVTILDADDADIKPFFEDAFEFIDDARRANTRCFVHCVAGVSRSVTLVVAYMVSRMRMSLVDAMNVVRGQGGRRWRPEARCLTLKCVA